MKHLMVKGQEREREVSILIDCVLVFFNRVKEEELIS